MKGGDLMSTCPFDQSIFVTIKRMLGLNMDETEFDTDILIHLNSAIGVLNDLGVGPKDGFVVTGEAETWADLLGDDSRFEIVKSFLYLKTKIVFDPHTSSILMQAMEKQISEYEWRICSRSDLNGKEGLNE